MCYDRSIREDDRGSRRQKRAQWSVVTRRGNKNYKDTTIPDSMVVTERRCLTTLDRTRALLTVISKIVEQWVALGPLVFCFLFLGCVARHKLIVLSLFCSAHKTRQDNIYAEGTTRRATGSKKTRYKEVSSQYY